MIVASLSQIETLVEVPPQSMQRKRAGGGISRAFADRRLDMKCILFLQTTLQGTLLPSTRDPSSRSLLLRLSRLPFWKLVRVFASRRPDGSMRHEKPNKGEHSLVTDGVQGAEGIVIMQGGSDAPDHLDRNIFWLHCGHEIGWAVRWRPAGSDEPCRKQSRADTYLAKAVQS
jgi:hypothetical protein